MNPGERPLTSPVVVRDLLGSEGVRPRRHMGQNFLVDANVLDRMLGAAELSSEVLALEIGAGLGVLTRELCRRCARVAALEVDRRLFGVLERELGGLPNLTLIRADAMAYDFEDLHDDDEWKMVANLPYRIAATIVVGSLISRPWIGQYTVMVQREVAQRLSAKPGERNYSACSVRVGARARVDRVATVSRNCFYPRPGVDSAILKLTRLPEDEIGLSPDEEVFEELVTAAFSQRRKKLTNSLCNHPGARLEPGEAADALTYLGISRDARAESLRPEDFVALSTVLSHRWRNSDVENAALSD